MSNMRICRPNLASIDGIATPADARIVQMAAQVGAAEARRIALEKERFLRARCAEITARGYRIEELQLVEQSHWNYNPLQSKMVVALTAQGELILPLTLLLRVWWRHHIREYEYEISADRTASRVMDGQS